MNESPIKYNAWQLAFYIGLPLAIIAWSLTAMNWGTITTRLTIPSPAFILALTLALFLTGLVVAPFVIYAIDHKNDKEGEK